MMTIAEIRPGRQERECIVFVEDGTKLRVGKRTVAEQGLYSGRELSEEEMRALHEVISADGAKERAARIISATNISQKQLRRRLVQKGESEENAEKAVCWLKDLSLLDDLRTGETIVRSALNKGYGERRIRQILREKGIPEEHWDELLSELPPMDAAVDKLLRKKLKHIPPSREEAQSAAQALARCGHSWADIKEGLERISAEPDWEDESCLQESE